MMINSFNTAINMGTPRDENSAVRNLDDINAVDAEKSLPKEQRKKEPGSQVIQSFDPDEVRKRVEEKVEAALNSDVVISAEDTVKPGTDSLTKILARENLEMPKHLIINGGESGPRESALAVHAGKAEEVEDINSDEFNVYAVSDHGNHNYNHDGIVLNFQPTRKRLNMFLAHGPQYDTLCASRTNAAALAASYEMALNPDVDTPELIRRSMKNVEKVEAEFDERYKAMNITSLQLDPTFKPDTSLLRLNNQGTNHVIIINSDTGKITKIPKSKGQLETVVKADEIVIVATEELLSIFEGFREDAELQLGTTIFTEIKSGNSLKLVCDEIIEHARSQGVDASIGMIALRVPEGSGDPKTVDDVFNS